MKHLLKVSISDFKLIFRDPSLRVFLALPLLAYVVILALLPWLVEKYDFIEPYVPLVLMATVTQVSQMFGFIYGMVFIEEKETQVAKVYGVLLPVSKIWFVIFRMMIPFFITVAFTCLLLLLQPFFDLPFHLSLLLSFVIGLMSWIYPFSISILSTNKLMGMTWIKVFNVIIVIPLAAFFVPDAFAPLFGILPTHWIFQGLNDLIIGQAFWLNLLVGCGFFAPATGLCSEEIYKRALCVRANEGMNELRMKEWIRVNLILI